MKMVNVTEIYNGQALERVDAEADHQITWETPPVVGQRVALRIDSRIKGDIETGTYVGVYADEAGRIEHWFVDGEIEGQSMDCFSIPAAPGTAVTDRRSPAEAIRAFRAAS